MPFRFPYQYGFIDGRKVPYPVVTISLDTNRGKRDYAFIMDSGADQCTLPKYMLILLDMDKTKLTANQAQGISKDLIKTWEGAIKVEFCRRNITLRCSFTDNDKTPLLLGKDGIFELFNITFDNDHDMTVFDDRKPKAGS